VGDVYQPYRPPQRDRLPFVQVEHGTLRVSGYALRIDADDGGVDLPVAGIGAIWLGPGVSVTHAAVALCAQMDTLLLWVGEEGVRLYAAGRPRASDGHKVLRQAELRLRPRSRVMVARRLYAHMLGETPPSKAIETLRGVEGAYVRQRYAALASEYGISWGSRQAAPEALRDGLAYASAALYGICESVILTAGYHPAIGFIHTGDPRSFVFDVADTIKFKTVVPWIFESYATSGLVDPRAQARRLVRDRARKEGVVNALFAIVESLFE